MDVHKFSPRLSCQHPKCICDLMDFRAADVIEDVPPVAPVFNQAGLPQEHQMLRNIGLPQAENRFHMADTLFAFAQDIEYGQTHRMVECLA
jgi:hypothetical protein